MPYISLYHQLQCYHRLHDRSAHQCTGNIYAHCSRVVPNRHMLANVSVSFQDEWLMPRPSTDHMIIPLKPLTYEIILKKFWKYIPILSLHWDDKRSQNISSWKTLTYLSNIDWDNIILCLIIIIKSVVWAITHCLGLGHETMVCAVCLSFFL